MDLQVYVNDTIQNQVIINDTGNNKRRHLNAEKRLLQHNSKRAPYTIKVVTDIMMQVTMSEDVSRDISVSHGCNVCISIVTGRIP